jgi:two-component system response regulator YesN
MLKVLIVDDEYLVITGLINCVDWAGIGAETPLSARNGEEALRIMSEEQIDILITDIAMSPMDGITLMDEVRSRGYDTEIIVLSCHNDFEYSRKAMQNGACDYLFKPEMMPEEIMRAVVAARDRLLEKRRRNEELNRLELQAHKNLHNEIHKFLTDMINGKNIGREAARKQYDILRIPIPFDNLRVIILKASAPAEDHEFSGDEFLLHFGICNALREILHEHSGILLETRMYEYVMLIGDRQESRKLAEEMLSLIKRVFKLYCSCGLSQKGFSIDNIRTAYEQASSVAARLLAAGMEKVGCFGEDIGMDNKDELMRQMLDILYSPDDKPFSRKIGLIFSRLRGETLVDLPFLNEICANMIAQLMKESMLNREALGYLYDMQGQIFSRLASFTNINQFEKYILRIVNDVESISRINCRDDILKAKRYIQENLSDPGLTIERVARHVNLSKNYFSYLFKKNTGQTFVEFLTGLRVEQAARLYSTSKYKIYQIAEMVGYTDWRYFTKVFKKYMGRNLTKC